MLLDLTTREKIVPKDGKFCVESEDGARSFGCFDSEEKARKRLAEVEAFKHMKEQYRDVGLPREWVDRVSPEAGAAMRKARLATLPLASLCEAALARWIPGLEAVDAKEAIRKLAGGRGLDPAEAKACRLALEICVHEAEHGDEEECLRRKDDAAAAGTKMVPAEEQDDPDRVCGALWSRGTDAQRDAFGGGSEGRGAGERPPQAWWDD